MSQLPLDPTDPSVPDRADAPVHPQSEDQHDAGQMEAKRADVGFMTGAHALVYDGDDAFMRKTGEAAVSAAPGTISALKQGAGEVLGRLSPVARTMLKPELDEKVGLMSADIEARARQEAEKHRLQLSEQRQALATDAAARHLDGDPKALTAHLDIAKSELVRRLEDEGADAAGVQAGVRGLVSNVVGRSVASRLASDPIAAQRLFDEHRERMEPEAAAALAPHVAAAVDDAKGRQIAKAVIAEHAPKTAPEAASVQPVDAAPVLDGPALAAKAAERAAGGPAVASAAAARVMAEAAKQNAARTQAIRQTVTLAQDHLERPDITSIDDLPDQLRLTLPAATRQAITEHYAQGGFPEISDDVSHGQAYLALARDPQGFLDADLTGYSTALDRSDFQGLRQTQSTLRQGGPAAQALRGQLGQIDAAISGRALELGVDPESQPEAYAAMFSGTKRAVDHAQAANGGKPLNREEIANLCDGQTPNGFSDISFGSSVDQGEVAPSATDDQDPAAARVGSRAGGKPLGRATHHRLLVRPSRPVRLTFASQMATAEELEAAAYELGMDPEEVVRIGYMEGTLDRNAKHGSHLGVLQFSSAAWKEGGGDPNKRYDIREHVKVLMAERKNVDDMFFRHFGRHPDEFELYLVHQQGWTGARRLLEGDPNQSAVEARSPKRRGVKLADGGPIGENLSKDQKKPYGETGPTKAQFLQNLRERFEERKVDADRMLEKVKAAQVEHISNVASPLFNEVAGTQGAEKSTSQQFLAAMQRSVDQFRRDKHGQRPDDTALLNMADNLLLSGHWIQDGKPTHGRLFQAPPHSQFYYDVDAPTQERLKRQMEAQLGRPPNSLELGAAYALEHAKRRKH